MIRRLATSLAAGLLAFSAAAEAPAAPPSGKIVVATGEAVGIVNGATVIGSDEKQHTITLQGPSSKIRTYRVGKKVNLGKLKQGDVVRIGVMEVVAVSVKGPRSKPASVETANAATDATNLLGTEGIVRLVAKVTKVDRTAPSVTLVGPADGKVVVRSKSSKAIKGLEVGDDVEVTFTDAVVVSLQAPSSTRVANSR
jgi:NMD protein affecting ribosome stability and mRNA decay